MKITAFLILILWAAGYSYGQTTPEGRATVPVGASAAEAVSGRPVPAPPRYPVIGARPAGDPFFQFVVEPYIQNVTDSSFRILCETSKPARAVLYFGNAEFNVLSPDLHAIALEQTSVLMHTLQAGGLRKGDRYFYQVKLIAEPGDTLSGPVTPVDLPDYDHMPVSFAVVGDTQHDFITWGRIASLIRDERPSFIVHCGDMVESGQAKKNWTDEFFRPGRELFRFYPLYPVMGNHEGNSPFYYQYLDLPGTEDFYSIVKGDILFVIINTNKDILPGSAQYRQLERLLAGAPQKWKFVAHHQPVYTSAARAYGDSWEGQTLRGDPNTMHLSKLFEEYRVDYDLNGHIHMYERTWPLTGEKVDMKNGVSYLTSGGGGGHMEEAAANKRWYDVKTAYDHHFVMINIVGNTLYGRAIDSLGRLFDMWQRDKPDTATRLNAPLITGENQHFYQQTVAIIRNLNATGEIYYRSGEEKTYHISKEKEVRLPLSSTTAISAFVRGADGQSSRMAEKVYTRLPLWPAQRSAMAQSAGNDGIPGKVTWDYYESFITRLPDFNQLKPLRSAITDSVILTKVVPDVMNWRSERSRDHWAARFRGAFNVPSTGVYRFLLESYDGSILFIDGKEAVNDDGMHYEIYRENFFALEQGQHTFEIRYFHFTRRATLRLSMGAEGGDMTDFNRFIFRK